ncbi:MAG: DJ-1/PfpI family protein [Methanosarcina sp.]|jgi:protease I|nr:DJ-1/PfpI family protein [Methanosarcina sp.]MDD3316051.1 DJ-1/PfpI family protein [Methanosarcina sp.]MDD4305114.1 DJ-1/PfpI family protein [Methanosarcina sp.]MDD4619519.1 DJ-1/PfpI family protein [Methanosarcina sp.]NLN44596.1 DJ-1/PfpI family protein [Methanosarcina sp.]
MSKKVLILTGDCAEDYEVKVPQQALQMLGYQVDVAAPNKKTGDMLQLVVHDFTTLDTYIELPGHRIPVDVSVAEVNVDDYAGLVVPGGRAPEYIRMYDDTIKIVQDFFAAGKPVAAICHGLQLLAAAKNLDGYRVTSYPACATECRLAGADWQPEPVITDKNLVTAQAWPNHPAWLRVFVELLGANIRI